MGEKEEETRADRPSKREALLSILPAVSGYDAMRAAMSSGWAVGAIIFGGVGPGVERLETGLLPGSRRSVRAVGDVPSC